MTQSKRSGFGWSEGKVAEQPHVQLPAGTFEEEHGRNGFFGRTSHLYHKHPPTGWTKIEGDLKPRAYFATRLEGEQYGQASVFLENKDVRIGIAHLNDPMKVYFRNGDCDELRFIHQGSGLFESDYGELHYHKGDYLIIPRGTTYRFVPETKTTQLVVESFSEFELPEKGMLGQHALFDPMMMDVPTLPESKTVKALNSDNEYVLVIKRDQTYTKVYYPFNPIDHAGWKGSLAPWRINVKDIRPVISPRYHLPPSVHTTFVAKNFVVCTFLPRPFESEEGAMKVPFYHRNTDFDEVIFYHEGNFFSREGIKEGAVTFHPTGIHHGPHPNAEKNAAPLTHTEEIAVMVDTKNYLYPTKLAASVEYAEYAMSWKADQKR